MPQKIPDVLAVSSEARPFSSEQGARPVHIISHRRRVTGFSTFEPEIGGKWLELLKEIAPGLKRVAGVTDPAFRGFAGVWRAIEAMAPRFGVQITSVSFHAPTDDLESAVAAFAREEGGGLIVVPTALNALHRHRIFSVAAQN